MTLRKTLKAKAKGKERMNEEGKWLVICCLYAVIRSSNRILFSPTACVRSCLRLCCCCCVCVRATEEEGAWIGCLLKRSSDQEPQTRWQAVRGLLKYSVTSYVCESVSRGRRRERQPKDGTRVHARLSLEREAKDLQRENTFPFRTKHPGSRVHVSLDLWN